MKEIIHHNLKQQIQTFLSSKAFGVIGASTNTNKYGNKVLKCYLKHQKLVYPVNPKEKNIEGIPCISNIKELPDIVKSISIVTPPTITEKIIISAINQRINNIWLQPGSYDSNLINKLNNNTIYNPSINLIYGGACILVTLGCIRLH